MAAILARQCSEKRLECSPSTAANSAGKGQGAARRARTMSTTVCETADMPVRFERR